MLSIIDIGISSRPWRYDHLYLPLSFVVAYIVFQLVYIIAFNGTDPWGNEYIYRVVKWKSEPLKAAGFALVLILVVVSVYNTLLRFSLIRDKLWMRCFAMSEINVRVPTSA